MRLLAVPVELVHLAILVLVMGEVGEAQAAQMLELDLAVPVERQEAAVAEEEPTTPAPAQGPQAAQALAAR